MMCQIGLKMLKTERFMLLINKKIQMTEEEQKLFGIDKLNIKRSEIPAVTHVDYSARIQTVSKIQINLITI